MWESYFSRSLTDSSIGPNAKEALRNATIESSPLSIRLLNDFFTERRYPTDIHASDYVDYSSSGQFLDSNETRALNKHLAHLTTERADAFPRGWSIYDMIPVRIMQPLPSLSFFFLHRENRMNFPYSVFRHVLSPVALIFRSMAYIPKRFADHLSADVRRGPA